MTATPAPALSKAARALLRSVLDQAAAIGLLGRGSLDRHIDHALHMAGALKGAVDGDVGAVLDLGSGGGIPGIVVGVALAPTAVALLDTGERRCTFLRVAAAELGELANLSVLEGRAESLARDPLHAGHYDAVTARSFGRPAVTAECATGFLRIGGVLVASEPPVDAGTGADVGMAAGAGVGVGAGVGGRWDPAALLLLGLAEEAAITEPVRLAILRKAAQQATRYPRRPGIPAKRPLW